MESVRESICKSCANKRICSSAMLEARNSYMTGCSRFEEAKPQTNADRIRAMTDEELAGFIYDRSCAYCPMDDCDGRVNIGRDACYKRWLNWLKQEVSE